MDLLKEEMARKRKAVSDLKNRVGKKYFKASQLREYEAEEEERELLRIHRTSPKHEEIAVDDASPSADSSAEQVPTTSKTLESENAKLMNNDESAVASKTISKTLIEDELQFTSDEVTLKLRHLGLPIKLFGEETYQQIERLRVAMKVAEDSKGKETDDMDEFRLGSGYGIRNTFLSKDDGDDSKKAKDDIENIKEYTENEESAATDDHKRIYRFFKTLLRSWEDDLIKRSDAVKQSAKGKVETKTLKQCKDYIRPLFKQCKKRTLPEDIMIQIVKIVKFCEIGEFVKANDAYVDVAIGRAAWPIGVTMVRIDIAFHCDCLSSHFVSVKKLGWYSCSIGTRKNRIRESSACNELRVTAKVFNISQTPYNILPEEENRRAAIQKSSTLTQLYINY